MISFWARSETVLTLVCFYVLIFGFYACPLAKRKTFFFLFAIIGFLVLVLFVALAVYGV